MKSNAKRVCRGDTPSFLHRLGKHMNRKELTMSDKKVEKEVEKKPDAEEASAGTPLDKMLSGLDALHKKLDAMCGRIDELEKREAKKDVAKKDAKHRKDARAEEGEDEPDEDKDKDEIEMGDPEPLAADARRAHNAKKDDRRREAMADAQARCDAVANLYGSSAPRPLDGESLLAYRKRLLRPYQPQSARFKNVDLTTAALDSVTFDALEAAIFEDARAASKNPSVPEGRLMQRERRLPGGHTETTFYGQPSAWMRQFGGRRRYVKAINRLPAA
jgi:hypothetical protein